MAEKLSQGLTLSDFVCFFVQLQTPFSPPFLPKPCMQPCC